MKNNREKMMLFGLLGVLALWQGQSLFRKVFIDPVAVRELRKETLAKAIDKKTLEDRQLKQAMAKLRVWEGRSLPPDPFKAQSIYQTWLRDLAGKVKFTDIVVDEVRPMGGANSSERTFTAINANVKAKGTLAQLCDFLHQFHESGLLQRVNQVSIESAKHTGNPELAITLKVEALSMANSPQRATLLVDEAKPPKPDKAFQPRKDYDPIVTKNLFVSTFRKPDPAPPINQPYPIDVAEFVRLTAAINDNGEAEAWLTNQTEAGGSTKLTPGGTFTMAGVEGKVVSISNSHLVIEIKGERFRLDLGNNLKQVQKL